MMRRRGELTIIKRLSISFGVIIVLLLSIAVYSQVMMYRLNDLYLYNSEFIVQRKTKVQEFENTFEHFNRAIRTIILYEELGLSREVDILANNVGLISRTVSTMQEITNEYISLINRDTQISKEARMISLATMGAIQISVEQLYRTISQEMRFGMNSSASYLSTINTNISVVEENVKFLGPQLTEQADGIQIEIAGVIDNYNRIMIIVITLTVIAAISSAYFAINFIYKKIKYIEGHVLKIKQGHLERVEHSEDEISEIVNAIIGEMTKVISEINRVAYENEQGNTDIEIDTTNFEGAYKEATEGVNRLIQNIKDSQEASVRTALAEKNSTAKSRFLARMSHEIRTPITAVLGISEIQLQKPTLSLEVEEAFAKIYASSNVLLGIVNDILDMSQIESGKMQINENKYALADFIGDSVQVNLVYIDSRPVAFKVIVDENLPKHLIGDEVRLKQIVINILSNAFKYTNEGRVLLSVTHIESKKEGYVDLKVSIKDTGRGMTEEQLITLFDEYARFRSEEEAGEYTTGTGLGMPITYSLIQNMGGLLEIESKVDIGTSVDVIIPQRLVDDEKIGEAEAKRLEQFKINSLKLIERSKIEPVSMPNGRVLIVDDVEANLYVAKGLVSLYDIHVKTLNNGQSAIEEIASGEVYDIIFMDQMMPDRSGLEVTTEIREMGYTGPIISFTANNVYGKAEDYLREGYDGFLSKPIQAPHLNAILNKFIKYEQKIELKDYEAGEYEDDEEVASSRDDGLDYLQSPEMISIIKEDLLTEHINVDDEIEHAVLENNLYVAMLKAHTLKTLAAMLGKKELSGVAECIEKKLKMDKKPKPEDIEKLKEVFGEVKIELQATLD